MSRVTSPPMTREAASEDDTTLVVAVVADAGAGARLERLPGARVVRVCSQAEALDALDAHPAQLLIVDVDGLGEQAFPLIEAAQARWPGLAVLAQSAAPIGGRALELLAAAEVELVSAASED